eukprot:6180924-Pleurochrysis_carterae.AAC.2
MLRRSAATKAEREAELRDAGRKSPLPEVSMPAAELFGCWAVAAAAAAAAGGASPRAVIAIGDCDPAAAALDAGQARARKSAGSC